MRRHGFCAAAVLMVTLIAAGCIAPPADRGPDRRNVILFVGDGMGVSTVTAARILAGQRQGQTGEEYILPFETFPNVALVKTYNTDAQVSDSAGTMTAIVTGEKTRIGYLSVSDSVEYDDCAAALVNELPTLLDIAEHNGQATGIVSTTRITHATPAALFSHAPNRNWETAASLPEEASTAGCVDLSTQFVEYAEGDGVEVVLGGGRRTFLPATEPDPEYEDRTGSREDGVNLIDAWQGAGTDRRYVWNREQFDALDAGTVGQVLGLFEPSHMQWEADRDEDIGGEPSLAEMTRFAIERLGREESGFFLMVEGGRIDHAHHATNAYRALTDTLALADAVAVALELTDPAETLILVTADHSHTFTMSGYPRRGNPIFGLVQRVDQQMATDIEGRPYTTLGYTNGPGYRGNLPTLTPEQVADRDFRQVAAVPLRSETHAGEDVAAYAYGLNADAVRGVIEQDVLFDVLRHALTGGEDQAEMAGVVSGRN